MTQSEIASGGPPPEKGTLNRLFFDAVERYAKPDALQTTAGDRWIPLSHDEVAKRVRRVAMGLASLGVKRGDRVAILSENRPEWAIADYGCLTAGFTDVPIYPTLPPDQIAYIVNNSESVAIFVSTRAQAEKIASARDEMPTLRKIISFDDIGWLAHFSLAGLEAMGATYETPETVANYREIADSVEPDDLATLIYTSGTTGEPKGVMLSHDNIHSNVAASRLKIPFVRDDVSLSFLPLSHIFQRMADYLMMDTGTSIAYVQDLDSVPLSLVEVRPTIVFSVPRLYEKMYARVLQNALSSGAMKQRIFFWARRVAEEWANVKLAGGDPGRLLALRYSLAQQLVFSKLAQRTGGRLRYFVSGGAPLATEINKFFYAAGLTILEGYGLTETSPVIAVNAPDAFRIGTVGKPIAGVEVKIAADGEILARGPGIMKGYYKNPRATAEAITADGWFRTGDIGTLEDGFLTITDRKKDLIVTAGGKNIAPQPIENRVKSNKFVTQAVMIGDKRKFPSILVVPNFDQLEKWANRRNIIWTDRAELLTMPAVQMKMNKEVSQQLEGLAHYETPRKVALLEHDFSLERGELTPTQKVKRRVVDEHYKDLIDSLYVEGDAADLRSVSGPA
ncbi:MAG TPA: long-chain fatty acid--CoA ligase [Gemmatimonadaceae bacterium]|jgi:long-chain acyl-CoA synthetase